MGLRGSRLPYTRRKKQKNSAAVESWGQPSNLQEGNISAHLYMALAKVIVQRL